MSRSRRRSIDQGNLWNAKLYFDPPTDGTSGAADYIVLDLHYSVYSDGRYYNTITIFGLGLIVLGSNEEGFSSQKVLIADVGSDDYIFVGYSRNSQLLNIAFVSSDFPPVNSPGRPDSSNVNVVVGDNYLEVTNDSSVGLSTNTAPQINDNSDLYVAVGQSFDFDVGAFDPDGDPLVYSSRSLPVWLNIDSAGHLRGTPTQGDVGSFFFNIVVDDGLNNTIASFEVEVKKRQRAGERSLADRAERRSRANLHLFDSRPTASAIPIQSTG